MQAASFLPGCNAGSAAFAGAFLASVLLSAFKDKNDSTVSETTALAHRVNRVKGGHAKRVTLLWSESCRGCVLMLRLDDSLLPGKLVFHLAKFQDNSVHKFGEFEFGYSVP